jgi:hypothetical protein
MIAKAIHATVDDLHAVAIGALRVLLCEDRGEWFAQGVEIDYAATGASPEEAKDRFARGLAATVALHLRRFGSVERLLRFAPESVWKRLPDQALDLHLVTVHDLAADLGTSAAALPFERIVYLPAAQTTERLAA